MHYSSLDEHVPNQLHCPGIQGYLLVEIWQFLKLEYENLMPF